MKIVGVDASTNKTGIALFEDGNYIAHSLIDLHNIKETQIRVSKMMLEICSCLKQYKPDKIIMEESMLTNNIATVKLLSQLAGAVLLYASIKGVKVDFVLPSHWRKIVGLTQSAKIKREQLKKEAIEAVKQEYGLEVEDDIAEAILIARSGFDLAKIKGEKTDEGN